MTKTKTAVVTGANKGIGFEIARRLAAEGYRVFLGARDRDRGEAAAAKLTAQGLDAHWLELDVTDDASAAAAAGTLAAQTGTLDVLVNNAGIADGFGISPLEEPIEITRKVYEVNLFGPIRVTQAFMPLLKASKAGRIVMMSSELGSLQSLLDPENEFYAVNALGYNSSKSALNAATVSLAKAAEPFGIKVNAADPGYTATEMNGNSGYRTVEQAADVAVKLATLGEDGPTAGYFNHNGVLPW